MKSVVVTHGQASHDSAVGCSTEFDESLYRRDHLFPLRPSHHPPRAGICFVTLRTSRYLGTDDLIEKLLVEHSRSLSDGGRNDIQQPLHALISSPAPTDDSFRRGLLPSLQAATTSTTPAISSTSNPGPAQPSRVPLLPHAGARTRASVSPGGGFVLKRIGEWQLSSEAEREAVRSLLYGTDGPLVPSKCAKDAASAFGSMLPLVLRAIFDQIRSSPEIETGWIQLRGYVKPAAKGSRVLCGRLAMDLAYQALLSALNREELFAVACLTGIPAPASLTGSPSEQAIVMRALYSALVTHGLRHWLEQQDSPFLLEILCDALHMPPKPSLLERTADLLRELLAIGLALFFGMLSDDSLRKHCQVDHASRNLNPGQRRRSVKWFRRASRQQLLALLLSGAAGHGVGVASDPPKSRASSNPPVGSNNRPHHSPRLAPPSFALVAHVASRESTGSPPRNLIVLDDSDEERELSPGSHHGASGNEPRRKMRRESLDSSSLSPLSNSSPPSQERTQIPALAPTDSAVSMLTVTVMYRGHVLPAHHDVFFESSKQAELDVWFSLPTHVKAPHWPSMVVAGVDRGHVLAPRLEQDATTVDPDVVWPAKYVTSRQIATQCGPSTTARFAVSIDPNFAANHRCQLMAFVKPLVDEGWLYAGFSNEFNVITDATFLSN